MKNGSKEIRLGIIGLGVIGGMHAGNVLAGKIKRCRLAAVCDVSEKIRAQFDDSVRKFSDLREMLASGTIDALLIATPHYNHVPVGLAALKAGLHVLIEKPLAIQKSQCRKIILEHKKSGGVFALMFNMRTDPVYRKIRELLAGGAIGGLIRVNWIVTDWFRTNSYYRSSPWRATWAGEGGGVLVNQCPHQLDLLQWLCGMPSKIRAFAGIGKRHKIEVEDEVTAYLEYPGGATGVFITSTGEAPGTNRLEIACEQGKITVENRMVKIWTNKISAAEAVRTLKGFERPPVKCREIKYEGAGGQHVEILRNFTEAILDKAPLIAPAEEGIKSVELANAMLYSALKNVTVSLPMSAQAFDGLLRELIRK